MHQEMLQCCYSNLHGSLMSPATSSIRKLLVLETSEPRYTKDVSNSSWSLPMMMGSVSGPSPIYISLVFDQFIPSPRFFAFAVQSLSWNLPDSCIIWFSSVICFISSTFSIIQCVCVCISSLSSFLQILPFPQLELFTDLCISVSFCCQNVFLRMIVEYIASICKS